MVVNSETSPIDQFLLFLGTHGSAIRLSRRSISFPLFFLSLYMKDFGMIFFFFFFYKFFCIWRPIDYFTLCTFPLPSFLLVINKKQQVIRIRSKCFVTVSRQQGALSFLPSSQLLHVILSSHSVTNETAS